MDEFQVGGKIVVIVFSEDNPDVEVHLPATIEDLDAERLYVAVDSTAAASRRGLSGRKYVLARSMHGKTWDRMEKA